MSSHRPRISSPRPTARLRRCVVAAGLTLGLVGSLVGILPTAAAADPIDGAQTSGDSLFPNVGNGDYDVTHYDIDLAWTPGDPVITNSTIDATTTITATTPESLRTFSLDFEGLQVDSITVNGAPATWERDVDADAIKYKLIVTPAEPVTGEFTAVIDYSGTPVTHIDPDDSSEGWVPTPDGATAVNEPIGAMTWYPVNNSLKDKATYDISLDIPRMMDGETMAAASNGVLRSKTRDGARETWHWRQTNQMEPYLSMISIGKYEVRESEIELTDGRTIRDWTFIDPAISASQRATTLASIAQTQDVIQFLERKFGPYPGVSAGAVVDNLNLGYALETQDRAYYSRSVSKNTMIHEIAHQWFGNAVSPTDWSDLWLNEGPGDYMPRLYNYETGATATSTEQAYYTSWNNSSPTAGQWQIPLAGFSDPALLFYYVYGRGGMTLESLRTVIGDEAWYEVMSTWISRYNGSHASTADFIDLAEEISGKDLEPLFAGWAYGTSKPQWPAQWDLDVSTDATEPVPAFQTVSYTLTATNTGMVPLSGALAEVDLSDLLDDATLDPTSLPEGLALDGDTLTWEVPSTPVGTNPTVTFEVEVNRDVAADHLVVTAAPAALGGFCGTCEVDSVTAGYAPLTPTDTPTISGTPTVGETLTADPGDWREGTSFTYRWYVGGSVVAGANDATYTIAPADAGKRIKVVVTGSLEGWSPVSEASEPTAKVAKATLTQTPRVYLAGLAKVGRTLTVRPGTWDSGVTFGYAWFRGDQRIVKATGKSWKLVKLDQGKRIRVKVTARKPGYVPVVRWTQRTPKVIG